MSFIAKVKNILGIGGVKMELSVPKEVARNSGIIKGSLVLTTKSDQFVNKVELKLTEKWTVGTGEDKSEKTFTLGEQVISEGFAMKTGETKNFTFALPFSAIDSENDRMKNKGGVGKALGSVGSFLDGEKSVFTFSAFADVKGVLLSPNKDVTIKLTV